MTQPAQYRSHTGAGSQPGIAFTILLVFALIVMAGQSTQAQTFTVQHTFTGQGDGGEPVSGLTFDRAGNLYGTTSYGGAGYGTVFKLSRSGSGWILTTLYAFRGGSDGATPQARVVFGPDGALYGTTTYGGAGGGTVFRLRLPATVCRSVQCPWNETVLYRFAGGSDGAGPMYGDLVFDSAGDIYGTTAAGGQGCEPYGGCGMVFKLTQSGGAWSESILFAFEHGNGQTPLSGVLFDSAGNLYGTLAFGGTAGRGVVYELSQSGSGWTETTLYNFGVWPAGGNPYGGLVFDQQGNLYGTTFTGGTGSGGTVYELQPLGGGNWSSSTLYNLSGTNGPVDSPTLDASGNIYATTDAGGTGSLGNVFKLSPGAGGWTYTDLYDFQDPSQGAFPEGAVLLDANGNLYGTSSDGGQESCAGGCGVVWEIMP